jgi:FG-GAP-like repeat
VPGQWSIKGTGDFNGDGKTDILWQDTSGNVAIWQMNGTAILNQNSSFVANVPGLWSIQLTGDFNGDGRSDILWRDISGNALIWFINGTMISSTASVGNISINWAVQSRNAE